MKNTFRKYQESPYEFWVISIVIILTKWPVTTLLKYQQACIFDLNETKPSGEVKYPRVKSCLESTMKKFDLGKEILGFTMCVRDKPIGLGLENIQSSRNHLNAFSVLWFKAVR